MATTKKAMPKKMLALMDKKKPAKGGSAKDAPKKKSGRGKY